MLSLSARDIDQRDQKQYGQWREEELCMDRYVLVPKSMLGIEEERWR